MIERILPAGEPTPEQRSCAVWVIAGNARDACDLTNLLDMLGLTASEARDLGSAPDQLTRRRNGEAAAHRGRRRLRVSEVAEMLSALSEQAS